MTAATIMSGASIKFLTSRACVPGSLADGLDREPAAVRTCARLRWRAHSGIKPGSQQARNPASHQSVADATLFGNWIVTVPSLRWRNWRTAIEQTPTCALAVRRPLSGGLPLICNFCRFYPKGSGRLSFRSLLKHRQEPSCVDLVLFSKNYLSLLVAHVPKHAAEDEGGHGKSVRKHG